MLNPPSQIDRRGLTPKVNFDGTYATEYPNGDKPEPSSGLTVLKREDFSTGTFAEKPWIVHNRGNFDYSALRDYGGGSRSIRHLLNGDYATDPVTGQLTSGLYSHTFISTDFYDESVNPNITFEQYFKFGDSFWDVQAGKPYPIVEGKLFLSDRDIDSDALYLGLIDDDVITIVSQNGPSSWQNWTDRSYGWKNADGTSRNNMYFDNTGISLFKSDGVTRRFTFEIQYNPGGIGYHKGRMRADGSILHDSAGINTDANGWFNLPIEYHLKGTRVYAADLNINAFADASTDPATYDGYAGGYEVSEYTIYEGVIS